MSEPSSTRRQFFSRAMVAGGAAAGLAATGTAIKGNPAHDVTEIADKARTVVIARAKETSMTPEEIIDAYEAEKTLLQQQRTPATAGDIVTNAVSLGATAYGAVKLMSLTEPNKGGTSR